ncbi:MAG: substrate-binding domain-containing protein [Saprospiraceae bacterium]
MTKYFLLLNLINLLSLTACVKKPEQMTGPTIGSLDIIADENLRYIIEQEEDIFERSYKYANVNITYMAEVDLFREFMADSIEAVITARRLTDEEKQYFISQDVNPREYAFATGAIAFVSNKNVSDTAYTYEEMISSWRDKNKGKVFVIENAKSGITHEVMRILDTTALPAHFYALNSKQDVIDYVLTHEAAIGIVDWSDISDSDSSMSNEILSQIRLLGVSRPADSTQVGFVQPYQYNLQDNKYPFTRDLYFISTTGMTDVGLGFASFIAGEIGQKIILKAGLLPKYKFERIIELNSTSDIKVVK